ncbi:Nitrilase family, member 2 [Seminavis robusta]|uniref:Nitrilase family, member 2 n=1 Tax=Seminavis robusta TaxID=568900 RepID=A0A9N8DFY8_9STRA|nr:Nitrilase family, member 2 [Seminavis robusta]|eukprot:Sro100_g051250.1 Nitrilase family, member 2 (209) ;mRNA; r:53014-53813
MAASKSRSAENLEALPPDYKPGENEVICVRGRVSQKHPGNIKLREIVVGQYLKRYTECASKFEKSLMVTEIVQHMKDRSTVGAFVRKIGDRWYKAPEQLAREKVGQLLRNLNPEKYKSSNKAKKAKRQADEYLYDEGVDHMMGQLGYTDISKRVGELTANAKTDDDFQAAFNAANSELLNQLKKNTPKNDDETNDKKPPPNPDFPPGR